MKTFKSFITETAWQTRKGKWANSIKGGFNSKEEAEAHYEKAKKVKVHIDDLKPVKEEAPANNTNSVPAGRDSGLHMKKMRMFKTIHRRFKLPDQSR